MQVYRLYVKIAAPIPAPPPVPPEFAWSEAMVRRYLAAASRLAAETGNLHILLPWHTARRPARHATLSEIQLLAQVESLVASWPKDAPPRTALAIFIKRTASRWCHKQTLRDLKWSRDTYLVALNGAMLSIADTLAEQRVPIAVVGEIEGAHAN